MSRKWGFAYGIILGTLALGSLGASANDLDLFSAGVAFPSLNDSVDLNPAGFVPLKGRLFDHQAIFNPFSSDIKGSIAWGGKGFGGGIGYARYFGSFNVQPAVAFGVQDFGMGANAIINMDTGGVSTSLGLRYARDQGLGLGVVFRDLGGGVLDWITLGVGYRAKAFRIAADFELVSSSGDFSFDQVGGELVLSLMPTGPWSLVLGHEFQMEPTLGFDGEFILKLGYWVSDKFAAYLSIAEPLAGIKIKI